MYKVMFRQGDRFEPCVIFKGQNFETQAAALEAIYERVYEGARQYREVHPVEEVKADPVDRPAHYTTDPSGVECIEITKHRNFCIGNAIKYLWRAGLKGESPIEDLKKAIWYINCEIDRLGPQATKIPEPSKQWGVFVSLRGKDIRSEDLPNVYDSKESAEASIKNHDRKRTLSFTGIWHAKELT